MFGTHSTNWDMSLPPKVQSKQPQVNSFLPSFSTMDWTWGLGYVSGLLYQWVTAPRVFLVGQSDSLEKNFLNSSFKWSLSVLRAQGKRTRCLQQRTHTSCWWCAGPSHQSRLFLAPSSEGEPSIPGAGESCCLAAWRMEDDIGLPAFEHIFIPSSFTSSSPLNLLLLLSSYSLKNIF